MNYRLKASLLIVLATLSPFLVVSSPQSDCCRPLSERVRFKPYPHHTVGLESAEVLSGEAQGEDISVVIQTPAGPMDTAQDASKYRYWRSRDRGKSWTKEEHPVFSSLVVQNAVFLRSPSNARILYQRAPEEGIYFRSDDGGKSWVRPRFLVDGRPRSEVVASLCGENASDVFSVWFALVGIHPTDGHTLFATASIGTWLPTDKPIKECSSYELGLHISTDGSNNWKRVSDALVSSEPMGISASAPAVMYGHTKKGFAVSLDSGRNWTLLQDHELLEKRPLTLADQDESVRILKGEYGLEVFQFVVDPINPNFLYVVSNKGVLRSADRGKKWCLLKLGLDEVRAVNSLVLNPKDTRELFVGTRYGVFFSNDRGCSFKRVWPSVTSAQQE